MYTQYYFVIMLLLVLPMAGMQRLYRCFCMPSQPRYESLTTQTNEEVSQEMLDRCYYYEDSYAGEARKTVVGAAMHYLALNDKLAGSPKIAFKIRYVLDGLEETPLHKAAKRGHTDTLKWLLRNGVKTPYQAQSRIPWYIDQKNKHGWTALHYAVDNDSLECVRGLLDAGANVNVSANDSATPLAIAYRQPQQNQEMIALLQKRGGR